MFSNECTTDIYLKYNTENEFIDCFFHSVISGN